MLNGSLTVSGSATRVKSDHVLHKRGQLEVFVPGFGWKLLSDFCIVTRQNAIV
jgi:hypothetical protein